MKRLNRLQRLSWLGIFGAIALLLAHTFFQPVSPTLAQVPRSPAPVEVPPLPANPTPPTGNAAPAPTPTLAPTPTTVPTLTPGASPTPRLTPGSSLVPSLTPPALPPALPPASSAPPATLEVNPYTDSDRRFQVGVLRSHKPSPLAGTVLVEAPDGNLAYTVIAQAQPSSPVGLTPGFDTEALSQVASSIFQRGESFQPGSAQPEAGGGIVLNWTGNLTIGGKTQPVGGVILVRPNARQVLLLLIAATDAGKERVPAALSALANSLRSP